MAPRRRRALVLIAAAVTLGLGVAVVGTTLLWLLGTRSGAEFVRGRIASELGGRVRGRVYVGAVSGSLLGAPRIDSIEIRDLDDSVLVATGPITFEFDLLDVWDKRIALRNVVVSRPFMHIRRDTLNVWNFKRAFARRDTATRAPRAPALGRKLGDVILLDTVTVIGGRFRWTEPWTPNRRLRGAGRDSAITFNLGRDNARIVRWEGTNGRRFLRTRDWRDLRIEAPSVRIKHPDSAGIAVRFTRFDVDEFDPPFRVSRGVGNVTIARDTVQIRIESFRLPGSVGRATGFLTTRNGLGVRVRVVADTMSMSDIAWIYPTLPNDGGGRLTLDIRKDSTSNFLGYALSGIDVSSTASHVTGAMTFGVSDNVLQVTNVDLGLSPVDFKLIEQFSGGPLPLPWAGQLVGHVRGPGGPIDRFVVDSGQIDFTDANVPGVVNRFRGGGTLDIRRPAETVFHDFALNVEHLDLRTAQALNPEFPPWKGWVRGTARLDSAWYDVRFREGDLYYHADSTTPSRFLGAGRVTVEELEMRYDLGLTADSVNLDKIALSYPNFALRGTYRGPFTMRGTLSDLVVSGELGGEGGILSTTDLRIDGLEPRFAMNGRLVLSNLDLMRVLGDTAVWRGRLNGTIEAAVSGDSAANLQGGLRIVMTRSQLEGVRLQRAYAGLTFGDGLARVDSAVFASDALGLTARGALGLRAGRADSLDVRAQLDSLGGARAFLARAGFVVSDSLRGAVTARAQLLGRVDSMDVRLAVQGTDLVAGAYRAQRFSVGADIVDVMRMLGGRATLAADGMTVGTLAVQSLRADADLLGGDSARVTARAVSPTGPAAELGALVQWDSAQTRTVLDSLRVSVRDNEWRLVRPARLVSTRGGDFAVDSLTLRSGERASLTLAATLPDRAPVRASLTAQDFPLGDLGSLLQMPIPLSGSAAMTMALTGTRDAPQLTFELLAQNARVGEARVEGLRVSGDYDNQVLRPRVEYRRGGAPVLRGEARLPVNLALRPVATRLLDTPISGSLDADSTNLAVLESFSSAVTRATGVFDAHVRFEGTWKAPAVRGALRVTNGAVTLPRLGGVRYDNILANVRFLGDSIQVDSITARSGDPGGRARLFGWLGYANLDDPRFGLRFIATRFRAIANRDVADLTLTTDPANGLRLEGRKSGSSLVGGIEINGNITIPESYSKNIIALDDRDFIAGIDTSVLATRRLLPTTMSAIIENLRVPEVTVTAGDNLWLRSEEADVKLGGRLRVTVGTSTRSSDRGRRQLALDGALIAEEGTYSLRLGPVQRTFVVENGGTVSFFGDPDLNPALAINAIYTVRQYDPRELRPDVRVRAVIGGTLLQPTVSLESPDSLRISGADLYSYLITGAPSIEIGGRASDYAQTGARMLVSSLGSVIAGGLAGRGVDYFDLSTAGLESGYTGGVRRVGTGVLASTRARAGLQITDRIFGRIDAGFCQFSYLLDQSGATSFNATDFANALGLKLDFRFSGGLGASVGVDPASSALTCTQGGSARGILPTPRQFGLDIFRRWRF